MEAIRASILSELNLILIVRKMIDMKLTLINNPNPSIGLPLIVLNRKYL